MNLESSIKEALYNTHSGNAMQIKGLPDKYPAYVLNHNDELSCAIPYLGEKEFKEDFAQISISTIFDAEIDGKKMNLLMLTLKKDMSRDKFANLCTNFCDPGENGNKRAEITNSPEEWWRSWKELIGNKSKTSEPYSVLGEMIAVEYLLERGYSPSWTGVQGNTHDIELKDSFYEIKSTLHRYGTSISINSIFQLEKANKELYLIFCRFEESEKGRSIEDVFHSLIDKGYSESELEEILYKKNLERGRTARYQAYNLLEMKKYIVDHNFPRITHSSFKEDRLPKGIVSITYEVSLEGLNYENLIDGEYNV